MQITEVSREDQALLLAIALEAITTQVLPHLCALGQATILGAAEREAAKIVDGCSYHVRKAVVSESISGYVAWTDRGKIAHLYVKPQYQKRGLATKLLRYVQHSMDTTPLKVRASINAVSFYTKFGFSPLGSEEVDHGIRYIPMELAGERVDLCALV